MIVFLLACTATDVTPTNHWGLYQAPDEDPADGVTQQSMTAMEVDLEILEGTTSSVWTYDGYFPGPLLTATQGELFKMVFTNELDEETTIHWHGLRIDDEVDGIPMLQEPVQPGETVEIAFRPPDAGTFWYHPHVRSHVQVERGLHGMFVVNEPQGPTNVPIYAERHFVLDDALLKDGGGWYNFEPSRDHMLAMHGRYGNTLLVNGKEAISEPWQAKTRPLVNERWRIVNTANARRMFVDVQGAEWRVIAIDGQLLPEALDVDEIEVPVGGRVDLEVVPTGEETQLQVLLPKTRGFDRYLVFNATVDGEEGEGRWADWPTPDPVELPTPTQEVSIKLDGHSNDEGSISWTVNGDVYGEHESIHVAANTPTRMTIKEKAGFEHPFHLHGQFFQVVERNGEAVDEPYWRDTVMMYGSDEAVVETMFENPGRWMAHCHILEHAEQGMMTELIAE